MITNGKIRIARHLKRLTADKLADRAGITRERYKQIELGRQPLTAYHSKKLLEALDMTEDQVKYIIFEDDPTFQAMQRLQETQEKYIALLERNRVLLEKLNRISKVQSRSLKPQRE